VIFNEVSYFALFLAPCVLLYYLLPSWRNWVIVFFGVLFFLYYGNYHFGGFWGSVCVLIFAWELLTSRLYQPGSRWCLAGIVQAVLILCAFKYLVFFSHAYNDVADWIQLPQLKGVHRLILPLGISFFTFEFIHYAADVYWGKIKKSRLDQYASFIFFFPTMVAGPIKRFQEFAPQIKHAKLNYDLITQGITRILCGLVKKHLFADTFALWSDHLNTDAALNADPLTLSVWILAYGMKIYFDFSGYSDIAIGSGNLFGIRVPENFNWPYLSRNITEFWRRWHISLGRWIFDYVYAPLGGSKNGEYRTWVNLMITFAVSGLWHGAAYNFILWGLWHGFMMVTHRIWRTHIRYEFPRVIAITATFFGVNIGWAFFCMDATRALLVLERIVGR